MTVPEALHTFELTEQQLSPETLETALRHKLETQPVLRAYWEQAHHRLAAFLNSTDGIDTNHTQEILVFNEHREIVFSDNGRASSAFSDSVNSPSINSSHDSGANWLTGDPSPFEASPLESTRVSAVSESPLWIPDHPEKTSTSGEWETMLKTLEADGLLVSEDDPAFQKPPQNALAALSLAATPAPEAQLTEEQIPEEASAPRSALDIPLFAPLEPAELALLGQTSTPTPARETNKPTTWDESLVLSDNPPVDSLPLSGSSMNGLDVNGLAIHRPGMNAEVTPVAPAGIVRQREAAPPGVKARTLESLPPELKPKPQSTGRTPEAPPFERRTSYPSRVSSETPRTYRDARERVSQTNVPRRKQPVGLWVFAALILGASAVLLTPTLRQQLLSRINAGAATAAAAPPAVKPVLTGSSKPTPSRSTQPLQKPLPKPKAAPVKPVVAKPAKPAATATPNTKGSAASSQAQKPPVTPTPAVSTAAPVTPTPAAPTTDPRVAPTQSVQPKPVSPKSVLPKPGTSKPVQRPKPVAVKPKTGPAGLPPVTRPEATTKPVVVAVKPVAANPVTTKPVAPAKPAPVRKPVALPPPNPVTSVEYQAPQSDATTQVLPGGLTRAEFGRQFLNRKQYEVWQQQGAELNFASWDAIPLETQVLSSADFRAAVLIALPLSGPERP